VGSNRSIVSDIAGTTRDYISEDINIDNNIFKLIDTAGVRDAADAIEEEGISRAIQVVDNAFYKILIVNPFNFNADYYSKISHFSFNHIIYSHSDQKNFDAQVVKCTSIIDSFKVGPVEPSCFAPIEPENKSGPIEPGDNFGPIEPKQVAPIGPSKVKSSIASLVGENEVLKKEIYKDISKKFSEILDFDPILISRHIDSIKTIYASCLVYNEIVGTEEDLSIISSELTILGHCISELIGIVSPDDVLHNIFDNFCIGK
jgi:tRNA modification GTPase